MLSILLLSFFFSSPINEKKQLTAYIFIAEECPVCNYLGKSLKKLSTDYKDKVNFIAVFPQKLSTQESASDFKKRYEWDHFIIKVDKDHSITDLFNATVTPEVVLVDEKNEIFYQGRINDSYAAPGRMRHGKISEDLRLAIEKFFNNQKVQKPWPKPIGCYITKG